MKMKILVVAMALSLGACSSSNDDEPLDTDTPAIDPNAGPGTDVTDPDKPVTPTDPSEPGTPTDPVDPVEPTDPVEPVDPTDPVEPADPVDPDAPTEPTIPVIPPTDADLNDPLTGFINGPDAERETSRWQCRLASATNKNIFYIVGFYGDATGYYANHDPRYSITWAATGNDVNYVFDQGSANIEFADITFLSPTEYSVTVNVTDELPEERICSLYDLEGNLIGEEVMTDSDTVTEEDAAAA